MDKVALIATLGIVISLIIYRKVLRYELGEGSIQISGKKDYFNIVCLVVIAFIIRAIAAMVYRGHETDINCFFGWSNMVFENGFGAFYSDEVFTDYPPGYMYVLYVIGAIRNLFNMTEYAGLSLLILKLPAIICDLIFGWLVYKTASKKFSEWFAILCAGLYLLNPVVILNSSIWGQVDAVFTLFVVLMCYFITKKKLPIAYIMFAIGILIKPQTMIFTPVLLFGIVNQVFLKDFEWKRMWKELFAGIASIGMMVVLVLPFGFDKVIAQYKETLGSYAYASVNGYNLWSLFGLDWASQEGKFFMITYNQWGTLFIILTVCAAAWICFKWKDDGSRYYIAAAFIVIGMFCLSVRMHERYMFPAMAMLLLAYIMKPKMELFLSYIFFSTVHFLNVAHALFYYDYQKFNPKATAILVISFLTMLAYGYFIYALYQCYHAKATAKVNIKMKNNTKTNNTPMKSTNNHDSAFQVSEPSTPLKRRDWIAILVITLIYATIAFYNLGDHIVPTKGWNSNKQGDTITLDLGENKTVASIDYYLGNHENRKFNVEVTNDLNSQWESLPEFTMVSVFKWDTIAIGRDTRYVRLTLNSDKAAVFEMVLIDDKDQVITPVNTKDYVGLFDEQNLYPKDSTFKNGTYFDEIYHARTAYEFLNGLYTYEWTHPPLGKIFIAIGMSIFGVNPFGWRFMGTLFGVIMVPIFYMFARRMFKESWLATILTILFTFDFMHFVQTRIATIDVYGTFFIILMYYFMYSYTKLSFYDTKFNKTLIPLGLSGVFMGFGCASKWTATYAGCGLAIIFFGTLLRRHKEYRYALLKPKKKTGLIDHQFVVSHYGEYTKKTILFCVIFFMIVPFIIYLLSYIPFKDGINDGLIARMLHNQKAMYTYHSQIVAEHPYSSWWYQWPTMIKPMWYYSRTVSSTIKEGISAFGNPLVWWAGIPAFLYMVYLTFKEKDKTATFLSISYLAQYVPWFFVTRITFIYHYFPSVPFVVLMIGYSIYRMVEKRPQLKKVAIIYTVVAVILFVMFYSVLSGSPTSVSYAEHFLKWFSGWVLI